MDRKTAVKVAKEKAFLVAHLEFELPILKRYPEGKHPNTVEKLKEKSTNIYSIYTHTTSITVCTDMVANIWEIVNEDINLGPNIPEAHLQINTTIFYLSSLLFSHNSVHARTIRS